MKTEIFAKVQCLNERCKYLSMRLLSVEKDNRCFKCNSKLEVLLSESKKSYQCAVCNKFFIDKPFEIFVISSLNVKTSKLTEHLIKICSDKCDKIRMQEMKR